MDTLGLPDGLDTLLRRTTRDSHISGQVSRFAPKVSDGKLSLPVISIWQTKDMPVSLDKIRREPNKEDIEERQCIENSDNSDELNPPSPSISLNALHHRTPEKNIIQFEPNDLENPHNWPAVRF